MLAKHFLKTPLFLMLLLGFVIHSNVYGNTNTASELVGSAKCQQCHQKTYKKWRQSHHWHAMEIVSDKSVLGDFDNAQFNYFDIKSRFFKKNDDFYVNTDNQRGELEDFKVSYTFGYYPLQQYLIEFPDGRLQALSIAWDSRPKLEGGQRWYHLYPDERIDYSDGLHWTGAFHNWNSRCASCHSTKLDKNYSPQSDRYDSQWFEINVACESCHGPGGGHVEWVRQGGNPAQKNKGWSHSITDLGTWSPSDKRPTFMRKGQAANQQIEMCASCHSRRKELTAREQGKVFLDGHSLQLLENDMYYADGQIQDEVYVYGSFLQSKMYREGVSCGSCHDPHSLKIKVEGNALCLQCHDGDSFNVEKHHHHKPGSKGAQCVNCHMPQTTYMGVDKRRDHSFKIPDPSLSIQFGIPNACNRCHEKQDAVWSAAQLEEWFGKKVATHNELAPVLEAAHRNDISVFPTLIELANDATQSDMVRATASLEAGRFYDQQSLAQIEPLLATDNPLLRLASVRSLDTVPVQMRYGLLQALVQDKVKAVRMAVAAQLAELPLEQLSAPQAHELEVLFDEYLGSEMFNADMPSAQINMALFHIARGDTSAAEKAYQHALKLSPQYLPALLNMADLYRILQRDAEGEAYLQRAISIAPESAAAHHALGLLYVRQKNLPQAIYFLEQATLLELTNVRYIYVYAISLQNTGKLVLAIGVLEHYLKNQPSNNQLVSLLASYYQQAGQTENLKLFQSR